MASLGELELELTADDKNLRSTLKTAQTSTAKSAKSMRQSMASVGTQIRKVGTAFAKFGVAAGAAGAAASAAIVKSQLKSIDALAKTSDQLGITIDDLQGLQRMAELNGSSAAKMSSALEVMQKRLGEAAQKGTGPAADGMKALGLSIDEVVKMSPEQQFALIADKVSGLENQTAKAAATSQLFSRANQDLVVALDKGSAAFEKARKEIDEYGLSVSRVDAAQVEAANDAILKASQNIRGLARVATVELAPYIQGVAEVITEASGEVDNFGDTVISAMRGAAGGLGIFLDGIHGGKVIVKGLQLAFQGVGTRILSVLTKLFESWAGFQKGIVDGITTIVDVANKIPGVEIPTDGLENLSEGLDQAGEDAKKFRESMIDSVAQTKDELHNMLMEDLPSQAFDKFFDDVERKAEKARKDMAENALGGIAGAVESQSVPAPKKAKAPAKDRHRYSEEYEDDSLKEIRERYAAEKRMLGEKLSDEQDMLREHYESQRITKEQYAKLATASVQNFEISFDRAKSDLEDLMPDDLPTGAIDGFFDYLDDKAAEDRDPIYSQSYLQEARDGIKSIIPDDLPVAAVDDFFDHLEERSKEAKQDLADKALGGISKAAQTMAAPQAPKRAAPRRQDRPQDNGQQADLDEIRQRYMAEKMLLGEKLSDEQDMLREHLEQRKITRQSYARMAQSAQQTHDESLGQARESLKALLPETLPTDAVDVFFEYLDAKAAAAKDKMAGAAGMPGAPESEGEQSFGGEGDQGPRAMAELDAIRERNMTEKQLMGQKFAEEQAMLKGHLEKRNITQQEHDRLALQNKEDYEEAVKQIDEASFDQKMTGLKGALNSASSLMNSESKKMFKVGKVAALAQAGISMYEGISKAWALGPILGPPAAALVGAASLANIKKIKSAKFGGGAPAASNTQQVQGAAQGTEGMGGGPMRNVYLHGIERGKDYSGEQLLDVLNGELSNGGRLMGVS